MRERSERKKDCSDEHEARHFLTPRNAVLEDITAKGIDENQNDHREHGKTGDRICHLLNGLPDL